MSNAGFLKGSFINKVTFLIIASLPWFNIEMTNVDLTLTWQVFETIIQCEVGIRRMCVNDIICFYFLFLIDCQQMNDLIIAFYIIVFPKKKSLEKKLPFYNWVLLLNCFKKILVIPITHFSRL